MSNDAPLDLDAYFRRIEYSGSREPNLKTLRGIIRRHALSIPFESLNPFLGLPVSLDLPAIQQKLVASGRGGYCFEQNTLLEAALRALGFDVTPLAARVVWNQSDDAQTARSHKLLRIDIDGSPFITDVGFGAVTPTAPLRLEWDTEQATPHDPFRYLDYGGDYLCQVRAGDTWRSLYRFDLVEQLPADYEVSNWWTSTHPESPFTRSLIAVLPVEGARHTLINTDFTTYYLDGRKEQRQLNNAAALKEVLTDVFTIRLPESERLNPALERLVEREQRS